ncbi:hypothetical protein V1511DRAFT_454552 [Dipodascopsis uninucleata]
MIRQDAGNKTSLWYYNILLEGYAKSGNKILTETLFYHIISEGKRPNSKTFTHLLQLYARLGDAKAASEVLNFMKENKFELTGSHYMVLMQICVKSNHVKQLFQIFDLLKFMSTKSQPTAKMYGLMISACAKTGEVEKALDLYNEMISRPVRPLKPTPAVLNALVYACSRKREFHSHSWRFLLLSREMGFPIDRNTMNSMLHICSMAGDLTYARGIIIQMCADSSSSPDHKSYQHLMRAYSQGKKTEYNAGPSTSVTPEISRIIHSSFLPAISTVSPDNETVPPFIPKSTLTTTDEILNESQAVMKFLYRHHQDNINIYVVNTYLQVASNLRRYKEFRLRFAECTAPILALDKLQVIDCAYSTPLLNISSLPIGASPSTHPALFRSVHDAMRNKHEFKVLRNSVTYEIALEAAYRSRDHYFATAVWNEREKWKRYSAEYQENGVNRVQNDLKATKIYINTLAKAQQFVRALSVLKATTSLPWTHDDLSIFYLKAKQTDNDWLLGHIDEALAESMKMSKANAITVIC